MNKHKHKSEYILILLIPKLAPYVAHEIFWPIRMHLGIKSFYCYGQFRCCNYPNAISFLALKCFKRTHQAAKTKDIQSFLLKITRKLELLHSF